MPNSTKKAKRLAEIETLKRKNMELEAQLAHVYHFASVQIHKAGKDRCMGSGVLVRLHTLGGSEVCPPFVIKNGLHENTIEALRIDMKESYVNAVEFKP